MPLSTLLGVRSELQLHQVIHALEKLSAPTSTQFGRIRIIVSKRWIKEIMVNTVVSIKFKRGCVRTIRPLLKIAFIIKWVGTRNMGRNRQSGAASSIRRCRRATWPPASWAFSPKSSPQGMPQRKPLQGQRLQGRKPALVPRGALPTCSRVIEKSEPPGSQAVISTA